jgi:hypothetical protein
MQDRYAGDVGDFGKFGLLRHLCGETAQNKHPRLKPGVIWYRVADETHNKDGECTGYLVESDTNDRRFRACDPDLYEALRYIVKTGRSIAALQRVLAGQSPDFRAGVLLLPGGLYWSDVVRHGRIRVTCPRAEWFQGAMKATAESNLVFLDPDNGIECANLRPTQGRSRKYVFRSEIRSLVERKPRPNIVIYHHLDHRRGKAIEKTANQLECLSKELALSSAEQPFGVLFHRCTLRAFLILPNQGDRQVLLKRTEALVEKWSDGGKPGPHFTGPIPA